MQKRIENRVTLGLRFPSFRKSTHSPPVLLRLSIERGRNGISKGKLLNRRVILLEPTSNLSRYTVDRGFLSKKFRIRRTVARKVGASRLLSLSLSPVINRVFTPNSYPKGDFLSFNTACVCVIPSTYLFYSLLFLFARFTSFRSNSKGGGFLIRVSFDKYFKFIVIISYPSIEPRETETLRGLNEICKQSYSEGKHVWRT